jgi:hypothetical protein
VFCVSLAVERLGQRIAGVIYDPTRDEMFAAELGSGARLNGEAIHVSATANLGECLVATGFPSHKRHKSPNIYFYHQITLRTHGVRRAGSAALDLCNVASGRFDGFWEFNLNPWDTAAGVLMVQEAGGKVTDFSGGAFQIASRETVASNGLVHDALLHEFQEIFAGRGLEPLPSPDQVGSGRTTNRNFSDAAGRGRYAWVATDCSSGRGGWVHRRVRAFESRGALQTSKFRTAAPAFVPEIIISGRFKDRSISADQILFVSGRRPRRESHRFCGV